MMGHNIDLKLLLGLPDYVRCSKCKEKTKTWFDDYDIDCGGFKPEWNNYWGAIVEAWYGDLL